MILLNSFYDCPHHPALTHHDINLGRINTVYLCFSTNGFLKLMRLTTKNPAMLPQRGFIFLNQPTFVGD